MLPQAPQWLLEVLVLTSQPSAALPLQSSKPALHMQAPPLQLPHTQATNPIAASSSTAATKIS